MPKASTSLDSRQALRHNPLAEDYAPTSPVRQRGAKRKPRRSETDEENFVDSRASRKILQIGQELADEDEAEKRSNIISGHKSAFDFSSRFPDDDRDDAPSNFDDDDDAWGDEEGQEEVEEEVDPGDLDVFNKFNPQYEDPILRPGDNEEQEGQGTNLADLILEKIAAFEAGAPQPGDNDFIPEDAVEIPAKVVEAFTKVGQILARYKAGKLPKIFKVLPTLQGWQTLLSITRPDNWTPNAVYEATRIFVSSKPAIVQEFLHEVLLERVRSDIYETHKLNYHLYRALKKALYKPSAFFKGILFPMLTSACTQREAHIVASVIKRVSVPVLHSAAAIYRLCDIAAEQMSVDLESAGATNICILALLEKKYALPWQVVDSLVFHFLRFKAVDPMAINENETMEGIAGPGGKAMAAGKLPVIWHKCLLAFAQRFRDDITEDQREALLDLLLVRGHPTIGPEIRRELIAGRGRGKVVETAIGDGGDDTMLIDAAA